MIATPRSPRRALVVGFGAGVLASVLVRLGSWLFAGRPASSLSTALLERAVMPHLTLGAACALLFWCLWLIGITWPPNEDDPHGRTHVWRETVAPLCAVVVFQWCFRLVRRADYDLQRIADLNVEVDRLLIAIVIAIALGYALGGGFSRRRPL